MDCSIPTVEEALADAYPDREVLVQGQVRWTAAALTERTRRLAHVLRNLGLGTHTERAILAPHESGQDHLALYLHDSPEYLEAMLGAYKARVAPYNVNYRYVADELRHVLAAGHARAVVYHGAFSPVLAEVLPSLPGIKALIRVDDGSGHRLLAGAIDYEDALEAASPDLPDLAWSPDDLYVLFTGGTTGMPKAVLWRQADVMVAGMSVIDTCRRAEWSALDELVEAAATPVFERTLVGPPLMHGAGQWAAFVALLSGGTAFLPSLPDRRDPADLLSIIERERVQVLVIVGDAFARPLVDELRRRPSRVDSLRVLITGGAPLTDTVRASLLELVPGLTIIDSMGSSEGGTQGRGRTSGDDRLPPGCFRPVAGTGVIDDDRSRLLPPGHDGDGWLATAGRIPLGYLDDPEKTARTFPVINGIRMAVPGDRARHLADGVIQLLGRDSATINSGGEKIFAEEVESAILAHSDVVDVTIVGRPSERWGSEVVAVVSARPGVDLSTDDILTVAGERLARYKLPKQVVIVDRIRRSAAGKADYRWARQVALEASMFPAHSEA